MTFQILIIIHSLYLQMRRKGSGVFAGKQGFITLRDLFRWAERYRRASQGDQTFYDWNQHIADEGKGVIIVGNCACCAY